MIILLYQELLALNSTNFFGVKSEDLVSCFLNVFVQVSHQRVFIIVDVGSTSNQESIITILVFKQEVTTLGRCVDRIMFRLNKFREIKHNQLVVVIVGFLLIDEDKEVDVFLAVQEFFRW